MWVYIVDGLHPALEHRTVVRAVEHTAAYLELYKALEALKLETSHWHWKREGMTGTLEVTLDERKNHILVIVHKNRAGTDEWAKKILPRFAKELALALNAKAREQKQHP